MVEGIIIGEHLKRVVGKTEVAVVVDNLERRQGKKYRSLANVEAGELVGQNQADGVLDKPIQRVIVQCSEGVGDVKAMVSRVEYTCPWGDVELIVFLGK